MKNYKSGYTFIELLIVITIVGILAAVAIPYYQGYMIRARLVEVENVMAIVKNAVSVYHNEKETSWPDCPDINAVRTSLAITLGAVGRISDISVTVGDGTITATVSNIHSMVDGRTIMLRPVPSAANDGSFGWVWEYGPGYPIQLRQRTH